MSGRVTQSLSTLLMYKVNKWDFDFFVSIEFCCCYCCCAQLATGHVGVPSKMTKLLQHLTLFKQNNLDICPLSFKELSNPRVKVPQGRGASAQQSN